MLTTDDIEGMRQATKEALLEQQRDITQVRNILQNGVHVLSYISQCGKYRVAITEVIA